MLITKRDGTLEEFNWDKIDTAITKAFHATDQHLNEDILSDIKDMLFITNDMSVEDIQDQIENALFDCGFPQVGKAFIRYRDEHALQREYADHKIAFIEKYKQSENTANATIDDNSNVANHNIAVLNSEIHKEDNQITNLRILERKVKELYPTFPSKQMFKDFETVMYLHDSSSQIGMPYTYSAKEVIEVMYNGKSLLLPLDLLYDVVDEPEILVDANKIVYQKQPWHLYVKDYDNKWARVTHLTKKKRHRPLVRVKTAFGEDLVVTDNHPMITDALHVENTIEAAKSEGCNQYRVGTIIKFKGADKIDFVKILPTWVSYTETFLKYQQSVLKRYINVDRKLGYVIGFFVGDGGYLNDAKALSFAQKDKAVLEQINGYIYDCFGIAGKVLKDTAHDKYLLNVHNQYVYELFRGYFKIQDKAQNKTLPYNILEFNEEFAKGCLEGLIDSDGTIKKEDCCILIRLSSRACVLQCTYLFRHFGYSVGNSIQSLPFSNNDSYHTNYTIWGINATKRPTSVDLSGSFKVKSNLVDTKTASLKYKTEGYCTITSVKEIEPESAFYDLNTFIYDITTETHTFASNNILVHNCVAISLYPFLLHGLKDIGGLSAAPKNIDSFCGMFVNLVFAISGQFKGACLYKDQKLLINNKLVKIKDFVSEFKLEHKFVSDGSEWEFAEVPEGYHIQEEQKQVPILKVYRRKYSDKIFHIKSKTGLSCDVSKDHKFKVIRQGVIEEVKASDLKLHDTVFVNKNVSNILNTDSIEYKRNFCLGLLLGDGCLSKENAVILSIAPGQEFYFDIFNSYSEEVFGNTLHLNKGHHCWNAQKYNKEYKEAIMQYLTGNKAIDKNIKAEYLQTVDECCGFLDGLMASDGAHRHSFGISLINKGLIDNCIKVLTLLNIPYTFRTIPPHDNKQALYNLSFSSCSYIYLPNFVKKCAKEVKTKYVYYLSNHAKKWTTGDLDKIDSSRRGKSSLGGYELDVITSLDTFDNDDEYVYEIETSTHWYNCGGFITHNCATPGIFLCMDHFLRKEWGDDYYQHPDEVLSGSISRRTMTIEGQIHQYFQQICYSLMQPAAARGSQAVFWNCSIFDKPFFETMYGDFVFPDMDKPKWESLNWLQKNFMHWLNQERLKCILTFPVVSLCLIYQENHFLDQDLADFAAQEYAEGNSFFTYISDSADSLSSCCRLSSKLSKPQFSFTNGQLSEMTGSKNVITLNLSRIGQDYCRRSKWLRPESWTEQDKDKFMSGFKDYLISVLDRVYKYQTAYNECLKDLYKAKLLSVYDAGFISMNKQYLTVGINALNQLSEFLGIQCNNNPTYKWLCSTIFSLIKEQNIAHKTKELMFNTEFTPCESAAIKLYNRDKKDGYWVPSDTNLYASYIFKPNDSNISVLDKFILHGNEVCGDNLDGRYFCLLNLFAFVKRV